MDKLQSKSRKAFILALVLAEFMIALPYASADGGQQSWSLNVGYHNPPDSVLGVNFLKFWQNFALEFGIGNMDLSSKSRTTRSNSDGTTSFSVAGDINLKYLFGSGEIRPYVQGGFGTGAGLSVGNNTGASASTGQLFGGGGLFLMGQKIYGYGSFNVEGSNDTFFQLGIGFYF